MKTPSTTLVILLAMTCSLSATAGGEGGSNVGNGGLSILCPLQPRPQLLDSYETLINPIDRQESPLTYRAIDARFSDVGDPMARVSAWLKTLALRDLDFASQLSDWLATFEAESTLSYNFEQILTQDYGVVRAPSKDCEYTQVILQLHQQPALARYVVMESAWSALSKLDQAALILHELVLRWALSIKGQVTDTSQVRLMTRLLSSEQMLSVSPEAFRQFRAEWEASLH